MVTASKMKQIFVKVPFCEKSDTRKRETCGLNSSPVKEAELPFAGCDIAETVSTTVSPVTVEQELQDPSHQQVETFTLEFIVNYSANAISTRNFRRARDCTKICILRPQN